MALAAGARLGPYEIVSPLGAGGMGEVYRAHDTKLGRDVAIKVLTSAFTSDPDRLARFEREARVLALLNHPNIGAIYGFEEAERVCALVLELVEGDTLADRIQRGPLRVPEALTIARQIANALAAAHDKGIVHRDLKPANIKITPDGVVKVLDFGLAKAVAGDGERPDLTQSPTMTLGGTREGIILGTAGYMSPEQARGQAADRRTDIWAFSCVLYEMLTSRRAFSGSTLSDTLVAVLDREPDWSKLPPATPVSVQRLLKQCLEKDPKRRLRDVADARIELDEAVAEPSTTRVGLPLVALRRWLVGLASASMLLASVGWWLSGQRPASIGSLAVLPFVNSGSDTSTEYLSDGISESLITNLSRVPNLQVKSRDSVFRYKGKDTEVQTAARELGVRAVLKGRLVQRGENLSIDVELVDGRNNNLIWRDQYSRKMGDILAIEAQISRDVSDKLRLKLTNEERQLVGRRSTRSVEAYQLYLRGRYAWERRTCPFGKPA